MEPGGSPPGDRELRHLGEFGLIARLTGGLEPGPGVEAGVGDDAAVLLPTPEHRLVVTTDVLVEGLDFTAELSDPDQDPGPQLQPPGEPADQAELTQLFQGVAQETALTMASSRPGNSARYSARSAFRRSTWRRYSSPRSWRSYSRRGWSSSGSSMPGTSVATW